MSPQPVTTRVIAVFGTKGGVGKTTVAANLAVGLAESGASVLVIDCDLLAAGDLARLLRLTPQQSLADIGARLAGPEPPDAVALGKCLTKHASGVMMLPLFLHPAQAGSLRSEWIKTVLGRLKRAVEYIILDLGRGFSAPSVAFLNESNLLLLTVMPDILALSQAKWSIELLTSLLYPKSMIRAVLNRAGSRGGVGTDDVRAAVPCEIIGHIPSDGLAVGLAVNQGVPLLTAAPKSKVSQAFRDLATVCRSRPDIYLSSEADPQTLGKRRAQQEQLLATEGAQASPGSDSGKAASADGTTKEKAVDPWTAVKRRIHENLVEKLNLRKVDFAALSSDQNKIREMRAKTEAAIIDLLATETGGFISDPAMRQRLVKEIVDEALGLGPLEDLLADPTINDILVNRRDQIYIERRGKLELSDKTFTSDDQLRTVIERIVAPLGRRIDESNPMVDARLADGSRVNAIIPPLALKGPTVSIRKFSRERFTANDLIKFGSVTPDIMRFLEACVRARKNIIISGGTGSGKTTFLNMVSSFIPSNERIITIEDAAELRLDQDHLVSLEGRPSNIEGKGQITIRDLFRNALRMRPDRIVIGECRGGETLDMLQAMNTGHDGSLTTIHANSPRDVISRMDSLVLMSNIDLPVRAIREQIVSAIDLIVHTARLSDGSRKVTAISEIIGLKESLEVEFHDLFIFRQAGIDPKTAKVLGQIVPTGQIPSFMADIRVRGIDINDDMFKPPVDLVSSAPLTLMGSPEFDV